MVEVVSLASGSSGNAVLVKSRDSGLLIDAGLSGRSLAGALKQRGIPPGALVGVLLTHEHEDHLRGAQAISLRHRAPVVANRPTLQAAALRSSLAAVCELETGSEVRLGPFLVRSFAVPHDAAAPVGYVIESEGTRIAYATDCGCPCQGLREAMRGANLCIVESNHDLDWLWRGPYPPQRKARVAGDQGHLSNAAAAALIAERLEEDGPGSFWLAHLSRVNNSPSLARRFVEAGVSAVTKVPFRLDVALRDHPSVSWKAGAGAVQPSLFTDYP